MPSGKHRPAIIVEAWDGNGDKVNLQVFMDGSNDRVSPEMGTRWEINVPFSSQGSDKRTWHWPEVSENVAQRAPA